MPPKKRFDKKNAISFQLVAKQAQPYEEYDPDAPKYVLEPTRLPAHIKSDADIAAALPKSFPKDLLATDEDFQRQSVFSRGEVDEDEIYLDESKLSSKQKKKMEQNILSALNDDGGARDEGRMGAYFGTAADYEQDEDEEFDEDEFDMEEAEAEAIDEETAARNELLLKSKPSMSQKQLYAYDYNKHFRPMTGAGTFFGVNGERSDPEAYDDIVPAIPDNDADLKEVEESDAAKRLQAKHKGTVKSVISGLEIPVAPVGKGVKFTKDFMEALDCGNENGFLDLEDNFYELAMASDGEEEEEVEGDHELDEEEEALIAQGMPEEMARAVAAAKLAHKRANVGTEDAEEEYYDYEDEDEDLEEEEEEGYVYAEKNETTVQNTRANRHVMVSGATAAEDDEEERKVRALAAKLNKKKGGKATEADRHVHFNSGTGEQDKRMMQRFMVDDEDAKVRALQEKLDRKKRGDVRIKDADELEEEAYGGADDEEVEVEEMEDEDYFDEDEMEWDDEADDVTETMRLLQEMSLRVKENKPLSANATEEEIRQASEDRKFLELLDEYEHEDQDEEAELGLNDPTLRSIDDADVKKDIVGYFAEERKQKKKVYEMDEKERAVIREYIQKRLVEYALEDEDMTKVAASIDAQFRKKSKEQWDVESICSTYSNVENIPTMIKEVRIKPNKAKIQISKGIHVPVGIMRKHREERAALKAERHAAQAAALTAIAEEAADGSSIAYIGDNRHEKAAIKKAEEAAANDDAEEDEDDEYEYVVDTSIGRTRGETKEQKKARKEAVKAEKAKKREQKKQLKDMFKKEKKVQDKMEVMNRSLNMAHKKL